MSATVQRGVGTQLKEILARHGIQEQQGCGCQNLANEMNRQGIEWCEANVDHISNRMVNEANRRKWPLVSLASTLGLAGVADTAMQAVASRLIQDAIAAFKKELGS